MSTIIMASAGQLCTAVLSVTLLKRQLSKQHVVAVTLIALGLMLRSGNSLFTSGSSSSGSHSSSSSSGSSSSSSGKGGYSSTEGALLLALASVLYSCLGVLYEHLMTTHAGVYTHTQV
jgi:drug/metabolite transporter (DMT)-like permease